MHSEKYFGSAKLYLRLCLLKAAQLFYSILAFLYHKLFSPAHRTTAPTRQRRRGPTEADIQAPRLAERRLLAGPNLLARLPAVAALQRHRVAVARVPQAAASRHRSAAGVWVAWTPKCSKI